MFAAIQRQALEMEDTIARLKEQRAQWEARLAQRTISDEEIASVERFVAEVEPELDAADCEMRRIVSRLGQRECVARRNV